MITKVTSENFEREVVNSARPCVLKFYNDGCHLCNALNPVLERLSKKYVEHLKFCKVDMWEDDDDFFEEYLDGGVPTITMFFEDLIPVLIPYPDEPSEITGYPEKYLDTWFYNYLLSFYMMKGKEND